MHPSRDQAIERVAFVVPKLARGGAERVIVLLARALAGRGIPCLCVCLEEHGVLGEELDQEGVPVLSLDSRRSCDVRGILRLAKALRSFNPTVINIHDRASLPYVALANLLAQRRPIVFSAHGLLFRDFDQSKWKYTLPGKLLSAFTAESQRVAQRYVQHLRWPGRVHIVPNGVPVYERRGAVRQELRSALGTGPDKFVFVSVGNAKPEKGFEDLLDAAARLRCQTPERPFECWIVGAPLESAYQDALAAKHSQLQLQNEVRFLGFQPDIQGLYEAADAFLLPSRSEGLPMVLLEAMMVGLPVVATGVGAVPDVVTEQTGLITEPRAPEELCRAMSQLIADPSLCESLGRNGRARAVAEYSQDCMASRYLEVFEVAAASKRG